MDNNTRKNSSLFSNNILFLLIILLAILLYLKFDDISAVIQSKTDELYPVNSENTQQSEFITDSTRTTNKDNRELTWHFYIPDKSGKNSFPVMVMQGGQNSSGLIFMKPPYTTFAEQNGFAILSFDFKNNSREEFKQQRSYQFPRVWAAMTVNRVLRMLSEKYPINPLKLYLFGFSAGAQFAHRYALLYPSRTVASAIHAAGSFTNAKKYVSTNFFVSVGEEDKVRKTKAILFAKSLTDSNSDVWLKIIPDTGHVLTEKQIELSLDFFRTNKP